MKNSGTRLLTVLATTLLLGALAGCNPQARGFALPPGDAEQGKETFVAMGCNACHSIADSIEKLTEAKIEMLIGFLREVQTANKIY